MLITDVCKLNNDMIVFFSPVFVGHGNTGLIGLLAAKVQNYRNCMQQTEGHLERLAEVNDKLR